MTFSRKLSFLMNLASVKNAELARALHIDPSQISRFCSGARKPPKKPEMMRAIALYIARKCESDYQRAALAEMTGNARARVTPDADELADILRAWLSGGVAPNAPSAPNTPQSALFKDVPPERGGRASLLDDGRLRGDQVRIFYSNENKRRVVRDLLLWLADETAPRTVMIASDENNEWMTEDAQFREETARLLLRVAQSGTQILHILPNMTTLNESFGSFAFWLPLYLTGNVRPYCMPKLRDGVVRRTLFIVQGVVALVSTSIGAMSKSGAMYAITGQSAVYSCEREFSQYLALCNASLNALDPHAHTERIRERLRAYYDDPAASIRKSNGLSLITIPRDAKQSLRDRSDSALVRMLLGHIMDGVMPDESTLFSRVNVDIMRLATPEEVRAGRVRYCLDDTVYTPAEYRAHLAGIVTLLTRYDNYHVRLCGDDQLGCTIYAKRDFGALLMMTRAPHSVLDVIAPCLYHGLWAYLEQLSEGCAVQGNGKRGVIEKLRGVIAQLDDA